MKTERVRHFALCLGLTFIYISPSNGVKVYAPFVSISVLILALSILLLFNSNFLSRDTSFANFLVLSLFFISLADETPYFAVLTLFFVLCYERLSGRIAILQFYIIVLSATLFYVILYPVETRAANQYIINATAIFFFLIFNVSRLGRWSQIVGVLALVAINVVYAGSTSALMLQLALLLYVVVRGGEKFLCRRLDYLIMAVFPFGFTFLLFAIYSSVWVGDVLGISVSSDVPSSRISLLESWFEYFLATYSGEELIGPLSFFNDESLGPHHTYFYVLYKCGLFGVLLFSVVFYFLGVRLVNKEISARIVYYSVASLFMMNDIFIDSQLPAFILFICGLARGGLAPDLPAFSAPIISRRMAPIRIGAHGDGSRATDRA